MKPTAIASAIALAYGAAPRGGTLGPLQLYADAGILARVRIANVRGGLTGLEASPRG